jgi:hypothetical protein
MADRMLSINSFKYGLDTRREALASLPGTLAAAVNCIIDSGGEIDKRKAFVKQTGNFGALTFGLQDTDSGVLTFGSATGVGTGVPSGVTYQRLISPVGVGDAMTAVVFSCAFLGKAFVIATFASGVTGVYYDGSSLVNQITDGVITNTALSQIARQLWTIVNRNTYDFELGTSNWFASVKEPGDGSGVGAKYDPTANVITASNLNYAGAPPADTATVVAGTPYKWTPGPNEVQLENGTDIITEAKYFIAQTNSVTFKGTTAGLPYTGLLQIANGYNEASLSGSVLVYSPPGVRFTPTVVNNNSAQGVIGVKLIDQDYPGVAAGSAVAAFTLTGGANGDTVTVTAPATAAGTGTAAVSGGAVTFVTSTANTAQLLTNAINDNTFITGYTAKVQGSTVTVYAPASFGAFQNNGVGLHDLTVVTAGAGGLDTVAGSVFSQIGVTVTIGKESISNFESTGIRIVTRKITAVVTGLSTGGIATFTWSQVDGQGNDIASPANFFEISASAGANITITAGMNPGTSKLTGRFRVTATDSLNGTKSKYYFTVTMTAP